MDQGPTRRIVQRVMSLCLSRIRECGTLSESEFAAADLPGVLRETAGMLEAPPADLIAHPEMPGVSGYEPSPGMLARAIKNARGAGVRPDLRPGGLEDLPANLGEFDLVLCCPVLSYVQDVPQTLVMAGRRPPALGRAGDA